MEYFIYPIAIVACFFLFYILSRNDFVLLRQNIAATQMFDTLFLSLISSFLFARAFYMINNFKTNLIGLLPFFHIVKHPGLSVFGLFFGGALCFYLIYMRKKGIGRIADIFSISFLPLYAISLFFENYGSFYFLSFIFFAISLILFIYFLHSHYKYVLRDGSIALLFVEFVCITTAITQYFGVNRKLFLSFSFLSIVAIALTLPFVILFIINQRKKAS